MEVMSKSVLCVYILLYFSEYHFQLVADTKPSVHRDVGHIRRQHKIYVQFSVSREDDVVVRYVMYPTTILYLP